MKIPFKDRSQMTMKEKIGNPLSVKEALELSKKCYIQTITDCWGNEISHSNFNKLPFAVRMQKGLVTQAEEERRKGRYGYLSDLIPSFGGSDAPYFADMVLEPIEKFDAKHFPDGREKNKAVTM